MKVCHLCGDNYKDCVDFCFNDGEVLTLVQEVVPGEGNLDAPPAPRRIQGAQISNAPTEVMPHPSVAQTHEVELDLTEPPQREPDLTAHVAYEESIIEDEPLDLPDPAEAVAPSPPPQDVYPAEPPPQEIHEIPLSMAETVPFPVQGITDPHLPPPRSQKSEVFSEIVPEPAIGGPPPSGAAEQPPRRETPPPPPIPSTMGQTLPLSELSPPHGDPALPKPQQQRGAEVPTVPMPRPERTAEAASATPQATPRRTPPPPPAQTRLEPMATAGDNNTHLVMAVVAAGVVGMLVLMGLGVLVVIGGGIFGSEPGSGEEVVTVAPAPGPVPPEPSGSQTEPQPQDERLTETERARIERGIPERPSSEIKLPVATLGDPKGGSFNATFEITDDLGNPLSGVILFDGDKRVEGVTSDRNGNMIWERNPNKSSLDLRFVLDGYYDKEKSIILDKKKDTPIRMRKKVEPEPVTTPEIQRSVIMSFVGMDACQFFLNGHEKFSNNVPKMIYPSYTVETRGEDESCGDRFSVKLSFKDETNPIISFDKASCTVTNNANVVIEKCERIPKDKGPL